MRTRRFVCVAALAVTGAFGATATAQAGVTPPSDPAEEFVAVKGQTLYVFDIDKPNKVDKVDVDGLQGDLVGIDRRPANNQLYGVTDDSRLYQIDLDGNATQIGPQFPAGQTPGQRLRGRSFGVDFNPNVDRLRVNSDANQNLSINPNDGVVTAQTDLAFAEDDDNFGLDPVVGAAAYRNNIAAAPDTELYDIETLTDRLVNQTPAPSGQLRNDGKLGLKLDATLGFEIYTQVNGGDTTDTGYLLIDKTLYTVDIDDGDTKKVKKQVGVPKNVTGLTSLVEGSDDGGAVGNRGDDDESDDSDDSAEDEETPDPSAPVTPSPAVPAL